MVCVRHDAKYKIKFHRSPDQKFCDNFKKYETLSTKEPVHDHDIIHKIMDVIRQ